MYCDDVMHGRRIRRKYRCEKSVEVRFQSWSAARFVGQIVRDLAVTNFLRDLCPFINDIIDYTRNTQQMADHRV